MSDIKWIVIDKQLGEMPPHRTRVLVTHNFAGTHKVQCCTFLEKYSTVSSDFENMFIGDDGGFYSYHGVIAWSHLPKPYEKK